MNESSAWQASSPGEAEPMELSGSYGEGAMRHNRVGGQGSPNATHASNDLLPERPRGQKKTGGLTLPDDKGNWVPCCCITDTTKRQAEGWRGERKRGRPGRAQGSSSAPVLCCVLTGLSIGGPSPAVRAHPGSRTSL